MQLQDGGCSTQRGDCRHLGPEFDVFRFAWAGPECSGLGGRRGKIVFDSKDLEPRLESSAATGKLLNVILGQLTPFGYHFSSICYTWIKLYNMHQICIDFKGMWWWTEEDFTHKEAAWKQLKPSLYCGQNEMQFRAAEIQLGRGDVLGLSVKCVFKK